MIRKYFIYTPQTNRRHRDEKQHNTSPHKQWENLTTTNQQQFLICHLLLLNKVHFLYYDINVLAHQSRRLRLSL